MKLYRIVYTQVLADEFYYEANSGDEALNLFSDEVWAGVLDLSGMEVLSNSYEVEEVRER